MIAHGHNYEQNFFMKYKNSLFIGIKKNNYQSIVSNDEILIPLPFTNDSFQYIFLINPFNYTENYRELFLEINRVLSINGILTCIFDENNLIQKSHAWQQLYLSQLSNTTGFKKIKNPLSKKFNFFNSSDNRINIYFSTKKLFDVLETFSKKCSKCGKPLGKNWKINENVHENCPDY